MSNVHVLRSDNQPLSDGNHHVPIEGDKITDGNGDTWLVVLTDDEKLLIAVRERLDGAQMVVRTLDSLVGPFTVERMFTNLHTEGV